MTEDRRPRSQGGPQPARAPELSLLAWGLPLSFLWEIAQSPAYSDWGRAWSYLLWSRLHCTVGDGLILLGSLWATALAFRDRHWIAHEGRGRFALFLVLGVAYTIWSEWFNVGIRGSWGYSSVMPVVFGIGLLPLAQWVVVPLAVVALCRRRLGPIRPCQPGQPTAEAAGPRARREEVP